MSRSFDRCDAGRGIARLHVRVAIVGQDDRPTTEQTGVHREGTGSDQREGDRIGEAEDGDDRCRRVHGDVANEGEHGQAAKKPGGGRYRVPWR